MVVLLALQHLYIFSGDLHSLDMEGLFLLVLPARRQCGIRQTTGKGKTCTAARQHRRSPAQTCPDGGELCHGGKGLGRRAHIRADDYRENIVFFNAFTSA
ncbi:unnamed protein product, partial [Meganyctiphanes norvegica]